MKPRILLCLSAVIVLPFTSPVRASEKLPDAPELPVAARTLLESYRGLSAGALEDLGAFLAVKTGDPRETKKALWDETILTVDTGRSLYLTDAQKCCTEAGQKGLPASILTWQTQDTIRWAAVSQDGGALFGTRNFMAQVCYDLEQVDAPAWGQKKMAIWTVGEEVDREYQRLSAQSGRLGSVSKAQLEADRKSAVQMIQLVKAVASKCRDLKKDMGDWHKGLPKPADLKDKIDYRFSQLNFDKDAEPVFHGHVEKWKASLEAWRKKYEVYYRDFGKVIEEFSAEKEVFRGHGKALEGLTFDEIETSLRNGFTGFSNQITLELSGR